MFMLSGRFDADNTPEEQAPASSAVSQLGIQRFVRRAGAGCDYCDRVMTTVSVRVAARYDQLNLGPWYEAVQFQLAPETPETPETLEIPETPETALQQRLLLTGQWTECLVSTLAGRSVRHNVIHP